MVNSQLVEKFRRINDFPELVEYLGDELDWPIQAHQFEEMTFDYTPAELGLDEKIAPKFLEIRRLRPLDNEQPWGIFFIRFDGKNLPVAALRRLLNKLVIKKRATTEDAAWHADDLLLISQMGDIGTKSISFAHFETNPRKTDLPTLKVLGWDDDDTGLKIDYVIETLREKLTWPDDPSDIEAWRAQWRGAFTQRNREVIQNSKDMAERLARLASAIRMRLREVLAIEADDGSIRKIMSAFQENLISDLDEDSFSDMYAQTIAYGLLSARIINPKANTADAAHSQIPITNPFLRDLMETFLNIGGRSHSDGVGLDFDELGINEVVELLDNTNMEAVLRDFGDRNQQEDPVMHFFEGFLQEYDSKIKKNRGVFYTPQPVVSFIVRSVDEQLRTEFGLEDGLADTTTWGELATRIPDLEIPEGTSPDQAFVQILDPATGTGTFPVEVIDLIYKTLTAKWHSQGNREAQIKELWNEYVPKYLLPRLYGYELMMAPYAIAHMKIGLKLYETGYRFESDERVRIYLTNALEPAQDFSGMLAFAIPALAHEAEAVNAIKRDQRFTVVIGNPPYSISSSNMGAWIVQLCEDYKRTIRSEETQIQAVSDDYVKFFRLSQWIATRSGAAICGLITNNGYLRGLLFRDMRSSLLSDFESILLVDLHGSGRMGASDHSEVNDENVFDIQTSVAISLMRLGSHSNKNASLVVSLHELIGSRDSKYRLLNANTAMSFPAREISPRAPLFPFVDVAENLESEFRSADSILSFFGTGNESSDRHVRYGAGFVSQQDEFAIGFNRNEVVKRVQELLSDGMSESKLRDLYRMCSTTQWSFDRARSELPDSQWEQQCHEVLYRPFDNRWTVLNRNVVSILRRRVMSQLLRQNVAICVGRQGQATGTGQWNLIFCTSKPEDYNLFARGNNICLPREYYPSDDDNPEQMAFFQEDVAAPNLNPAVINAWTNSGVLSSSAQGESCKEVFSYIYGLLHSNQYRERYGEFLAMEFPRIFEPRDRELLLQIARCGDLLLSLHLLESHTLYNHVTTLTVPDDALVEKITYSDETVWIDKKKTRGFEGVPEEVWNFSIGGYQVCEKWLKDRGPKKGKPGRTLTDDDIDHYQKIIFSISETIRIMAEIDEVIEGHGGWPDAFVTSEN